MSDNRSPAVDAYLAGLDHPRRDDVAALRATLLDADPELSESVKWNAPNLRYAGEDRVTFRLHPGGRFQLVLHRGATVREDVDAFSFDDPTGLVAWATPDRGVLALDDALAGPDGEAGVVDLVRRWLRA
jgi:hypothetical protein